MTDRKKQSEKRSNELIATERVILVDRNEELSLAAAIIRAREAGGDLLEVVPGHDPARCRIWVEAQEVPPLERTEAPAPLVAALEALDAENQPFRRIHRLIDAVEVFAKLHTVVVVSDIFSGESVTEEMRGILAAGLKQPSLGHWWMFAREFGRRYETLGKSPVLPGLDRFVGKGGGLFRILEGKNNLLTFRNGYAHGATPADDDCVRDCVMHEPRLLAAIASAHHLREGLWVYVDSAGRCMRATGSKFAEIDPPAPGLAPLRCYLVRGGTVISLHPLLIYREDEGRFFLYNDIKGKEANFLNYERALRWRDAGLHRDLLARYPLHDWVRHIPEDFAERLRQLTERFKGRRSELRELLRFCEDGQMGFRMIWGGPGIGKSALLARLVEMLRWPAEVRAAENLPETASSSEAPPLSCLSGSPPEALGHIFVFEYFIRRGQRTADADYLLENLNGRIERAFRTGIPLGNSAAEKARFLEERLVAAASRLAAEDRIVLFVDGLDEGADALGLLAVLPKELPERVVALYASRDVPSVRQGVYENLARERRSQLYLGGLARGDVRAVLADTVSKYDLRDDYLDGVVTASEGNPLYLALLCDGLVEGDYRINEIDRLPRGMEELYDIALRRITETSGAGDFLRLLAESRDDLSPEMASSLLNLPVDEVAGRIIPACLELLVENERTEDLEDYQLFHESLRHYLRAHFPIESRKWRSRLAVWCLAWRTATGDARPYALTHLAAHAGWLLGDLSLGEADRLRGELFTLLNDEAYCAASFETLGHGGGFQAHCRLLLDQLPHLPSAERRNLAARVITRFHCEPEDRFCATLREIDRARDEPSRLPGLALLARAGRSPRARVLLGLRGLGGVSGTAVPIRLREDLATWAEEANEPALTALVEASLNDSIL